MESSKQEMDLFEQEIESFYPLPGLCSKNFFCIILSIFTNEFKIEFQNRKLNYPNRKLNYFSNFRACDQKTPFTICFIFDLRGSKLISKQEMELSKQEMELFL